MAAGHASADLSAQAIPAHTSHGPTTHTAERLALAAITVLVAAIAAIGFYGSWGALKDAALAAHVSADAAWWYPFGVDGLTAVSLVCAVVLRHERYARWYCLTVLIVTTAASLALNFCHGLGLFETGRLVPWCLTLVTTSMSVASIGFASHLLVFTARRLIPSHPGTTAAPARSRPTVRSPRRRFSAAAKRLRGLLRRAVRQASETPQDEPAELDETPAETETGETETPETETETDETVPLPDRTVVSTQVSVIAAMLNAGQTPTVDEIATRFGLKRATAHRRLTAARKRCNKAG